MTRALSPPSPAQVMSVTTETATKTAELRSLYKLQFLQCFSVKRVPRGRVEGLDDEASSILFLQASSTSRRSSLRLSASAPLFSARACVCVVVPVCLVGQWCGKRSPSPLPFPLAQQPPLHLSLSLSVSLTHISKVCTLNFGVCSCD